VADRNRARSIGPSRQSIGLVIFAEQVSSLFSGGMKIFPEANLSPIFFKKISDRIQRVLQNDG
jgi:hypothetical protein